MKTLETIDIFDYETDTQISAFSEDESIDLYSPSESSNDEMINQPFSSLLSSLPSELNKEYFSRTIELSGVRNNTKSDNLDINSENGSIKELPETQSQPVATTDNIITENSSLNPLTTLLIRANKLADAIVNKKELEASFFLAADETPLSEDEIYSIVNQAENLEFIECEGLDVCNTQQPEIKTETQKLFKSETTSKSKTKKDTQHHFYYSSHFINKPDLQSLPKPGFNDKEQKSIEEDIIAESSLVIEESIDDIKTKLLDYWHLQCEQCEDISDKVVILENDHDVEQYINNFPDIPRKEKLHTLLEYFGNLFEQLPEDTLNNFAKSEYFDMYIEFMNQLKKQ
ncbi:MAG: hypothetical protein PF637_03040 [Spirochaetes bacterium]|nr:hypothetical protein [Spirochaetota bacterium]